MDRIFIQIKHGLTVENNHQYFISEFLTIKVNL